MISLREKTVLVTGGSRGIGAECVKVMCRAGAHVILHFNSSAKAAKKVISECGSSAVLAIQSDLSAAGGAKKLWERSLKWKGSIDALVNNAGVMTAAAPGSADSAWQKEWEKTLQVNLVAAADLCRRAVGHYQSRARGGVIVNIASRAAFRGDDADYAHYAASKAGMVALSRTLARAYAKDNILVYTIAPGFVDTELNADFLKQHGKEKIVRDIPLKRFADPEEVAQAAAFFASGVVPSATGTNLDINGASYLR